MQSEHLLFMGTKRFPKENDYQQYLSANNGHSNAYTAMTSTNYYFDIAPDALEGALDRFSGFFIEPLFNEDCTEREIKAVDSEHKKNLQNDMWASQSPPPSTGVRLTANRGSTNSKSIYPKLVIHIANSGREITIPSGLNLKPTDEIHANSSSHGGRRSIAPGG